MDKLPFIPEHIYIRRELHDKYGGNRQAGIAPSAVVPYIFIFSGKSGAQYGYKDGWDNETIFSYTGEGQIGDMHFNRGNLALKEHLNHGKRVFLFESERSGYVKFISELEFCDADYDQALDINKNKRIAIRFFFTRKGVHILTAPRKLNVSSYPGNIIYKNDYIIPNVTERAGLIVSRVGQGAYRKRIIYRWDEKCAVTGFSDTDILIASHIVPWANSTDEERLDVNNGLLLSPVYDALFDRHLISFDNKGKILLSSGIDTDAYTKIGVTGKEQIVNLSMYNEKYLKRHNEIHVMQQTIPII